MASGEVAVLTANELRWYLPPGQGLRAPEHLLMAGVGEPQSVHIATRIDAPPGRTVRSEADCLGSSPRFQVSLAV